MRKITILGIMVMVFTMCATISMKSGNDTFNKDIANGKDIYIEGKTFTDTIDFTKMLVNNTISETQKQIRIASSITFVNCVFEKGIVACRNDEAGNNIFTQFQSNVSFINCSFKGNTTFRACQVMGRCVFTGSSFVGQASFEEVSFMQNTYFNKCSFHKEARFQNATFIQKVNFLDTQFDDIISFQGSSFYSSAQFSNTKFRGYSDFSITQWRDKAFFNYIEVSDRVFFNSSYFAQNIEFLKAKLNKFEMNNCQVNGKLFIAGVQSNSKINFENNTFLQEKAIINQ